MFFFISEKEKVSSSNITSFNFLYSVPEQWNSLGNSQSLFHVPLSSILPSRLFLLSFQKFCPHLCAMSALFLSFILIALFGIHRLLFGFSISSYYCSFVISSSIFCQCNLFLHFSEDLELNWFLNYFMFYYFQFFEGFAFSADLIFKLLYISMLWFREGGIVLTENQFLSVCLSLSLRIVS